MEVYYSEEKSMISEGCPKFCEVIAKEESGVPILYKENQGHKCFSTFIVFKLLNAP